MNAFSEPQVAQAFRSACAGPLFALRRFDQPPVLKQADVLRLLPHRGLMQLIDDVEWLDEERRLIQARYDLGRAREILDGHFPGSPIWPGVFQQEAIGQAGILLARLLNPKSDAPPVSLALTHVLGARFLRPVQAGGSVVLAAQLIEEGLFHIIVGQCLQNDTVCSVAAMCGLETAQEK